jgi:hypothetical protein
MSFIKRAKFSWRFFNDHKFFERVWKSIKLVYGFKVLLYSHDKIYELDKKSKTRDRANEKSIDISNIRSDRG